MFEYEKLETEKYFDFSLEVKEKRQRRMRSFVNTVWSMTAVMTTALVAGVFFLQNTSQGLAEVIYSAVSFSSN